MELSGITKLVCAFKNLYRLSTVIHMVTNSSSVSNFLLNVLSQCLWPNSSVLESHRLKDLPLKVFIHSSWLEDLFYLGRSTFV